MLFLLVTSITLISCAHQSQWELTWVENFNEEELDTTVWSTIPRGKPDWQNTMSSDERCYELRDGKLILRESLTKTCRRMIHLI